MALFCSKCGTKIDIETARFCPKCGSQLPWGMQAPGGDIASEPANGHQQVFPSDVRVDRQEEKNNPILPIILSVIAAIAVISVVVLALSKMKIVDLLIPSFGRNVESESRKAEEKPDQDSKETRTAKEDGSKEKGLDKNDQKDDGSKNEPVVSEYDSFKTDITSKKQVNLKFVSADVSDYPTVRLYYTVEDSSGDTFLLSSPNVAIKERVKGGKEIVREVKSIDVLEGHQGVSFDICADKSGSMSYDMPAMQQIMTEFVNALDYESGDRAELISFDSYIMYMCTYTNNPALLRNGISNMVADGQTAFYDALYEGVMNAGAQEGARCVIAFTDGEDNMSYRSYQEVIDLANSLQVPIFIVGTYADYSNVYSMIAEKTGGRFWTIDSISGMSQILDEIYKIEKDMYCIEYISDDYYDAYDRRWIECLIGDEDYGACSEANFTPTKAREEKSHTSRYEVIKEDISWTEANAKCIQNGGHLVTITSQDEMDRVAGLCENAGLEYVWMGGYTSVYGDSSFGHWITGEDFRFTSWYPGEPSRHDRNDGEEEMYLMLWKIKNVWSWNDQRNDVFTTGLTYFHGKLGYVCEYED